MVTYNDLQKAISENRVKDFVKDAINKHKSSEEYQIALCADEYNRRRNRTIMEF